MSLPERASINGDIARALHRFYLSQQDKHRPTYKISLGKLCHVINYDPPDNTPRYKRKQIKKALAELCRIQFIKSGWFISDKDIVVVQIIANSWKKYKDGKKILKEKTQSIRNPEQSIRNPENPTRPYGV